jgi:hypothetical protein
MPETVIHPSASAASAEAVIDNNTNLAPAPEITSPPLPEQAPLTPEQEAIQTQRAQWAAENPGKSYLTPEGPTIGPEDKKRLEAEAENYGFDSFVRSNLVETYQAIQNEGANREAAIRKKLQAPGENYSPNVIERLAAKARADATDLARSKLIEIAVPIPGKVSRGEASKINTQREQLLSMLSKSPEEFSAIQADWQAYEDIQHTNTIGDIQSEALKDDKKLNAVQEKKRLKKKVEQLEDKYSGSLEYISKLGLESDAKAVEILKIYQESLARHKSDEEYIEADQNQAFDSLVDLLLAARQDEAGSPLTAEAVEKKVQEATPYLETWLESIAAAEGDPLADISDYKNKQRAYELWDQRRQQAVEYLGPVVLLRTVQNMLHRQPEQKTATPAEAGKVLKTLLDPRRIGEKNGGHALRHAEELSDRDVNVYRSGIMGQLEQARTYSRHQGSIMKTALMVNALAVGGAQELDSMWYSLSESERSKEFKKKMLGKAAVGSLLAKRLAAKAAQKAKSSAKAAAKAPGSGFFGDQRKED